MEKRRRCSVRRWFEQSLNERIERFLRRPLSRVVGESRCLDGFPECREPNVKKGMDEDERDLP